MKLALVFVLVTVSPAWGWVRRISPTGAPIRWTESCVTVHPDADAGPDVSPATLDRILRAAASHWQTSCSYLALEIGDAVARGADSSDHVNTVSFRTPWCVQGDPASESRCADPEAIALTNLSYVSAPGAPDDGKLLDADIELNAERYTFATGPGTNPRPGTTVEDLESVLTHELGHLMGMGHTCGLVGGTEGLDQDGARPPRCIDVPTLPPAEQSLIVHSVMYPFAPPGQVNHQPSADDQAGLCAIYPSANDPHQCGPQAAAACTASPGGRPETPLLLLTVLGLWAAWRRTREDRTRAA
jgi:hypothetical protein